MAGVNSAILRNVGLKIRETRIEYDITQSELANAIGSNKSKISNIETGQTIPSIETLVKIGDAMGIPITDFFVVNLPCERESEEKRVKNYFIEASDRVSRLSGEKQEGFMDTMESLLRLTGV